jgi:hypothetical protein
MYSRASLGSNGRQSITRWITISALLRSLPGELAVHIDESIAWLEEHPGRLHIRNQSGVEAVTGAQADLIDGGHLDETEVHGQWCAKLAPNGRCKSREMIRCLDDYLCVKSVLRLDEDLDSDFTRASWSLRTIEHVATDLCEPNATEEIREHIEAIALILEQQERRHHRQRRTGAASHLRLIVRP